MSTAYKLTSLADARPGMVLGDVLLDDKGNVLLAQDVVLTAPMLTSLARHGVAMLPILTQGAGPAAPAPDPALVEARLERLFRRHQRDDHGDWATGVLRRYVEDYRLRREVQS